MAELFRIRSMCMLLCLSAAHPAFAQEENLFDLPLTELMNIKVITASKTVEENAFKTPGIVSVITRREIESFGARNLAQVLSRFTSMYQTGSPVFSETVLALRGDINAHYNSHILLLLNGRPMREKVTGGNDVAILKAFPLAAIERVELVRGPGSVLYGTNAFTGVINIITRQPKKEFGGEARVAGGGYKDKRGVLLAEYENLLAATRYSDSEGWPHKFTTRTGVTDNVDFRSRESGNFGYFSRGGWTASVYHGKAFEDLIGTLHFWPKEENRLVRVFADLGYQHGSVESWLGSYNLTFNRIQTRMNPDQSIYDTEYSGDDVQLETTHTVALGDKLSVIAGGTASQNKSKGSSGFRDADEEDVYSLYSQLEWLPDERLKVYAGGQFNKVESFDGDLVPRAGVVSTFSENWGTKVLYSGAFRTPVAIERRINAGVALQGNPNLKPEKVYTLDLQLNHHSAASETSLTLFDSQYDNLIHRVNEAGTNYYRNASSRKTQGVELETKYMPGKNTLIKAGATYQVTKVGAVEDYSSPPRWIGQLGVSQDFNSGIRVGAYDVYYSKPKLETGSKVNPSAKDEHFITLETSFYLAKLLGRPKLGESKLSLYVENILDEKYYHPEFDRKEVNSFPFRGGRAISAELTYDF